MTQYIIKGGISHARYATLSCNLNTTIMFWGGFPIKEKVPGLLINAWYLDDGTICGSSRDLQKALDIIEEDRSACGLHPNRAKSLLLSSTTVLPECN